MKTVSLIKDLLVLAAAFGLAACGGGDKTLGQSPQQPNQGIFTDSPVAGVTFQTASLRGVTGATGEFQYYPGETVTFSIGDVIIGSAPAGPKLTPIDLSPSHNDTNPTTINIARFLQSLDSDNNLDNGIQITPKISAEMLGKNIDFSKSTAEFNDSNIQSLFAELNRKGVFTNGNTRSLADDLTAQYNMRLSLNPSKGPFDGEWQTSYEYPSDTGSSGVTISISGANIDRPPAVPNTGNGRVAISGSKVTFTPVNGVAVVGAISDSGIITIPDRTMNCNDGSGGTHVLSSNLTLNTNGSVDGAWQITLPAPAIGYCLRYPIRATFHPMLHLDPFTSSDITLLGVPPSVGLQGTF